MPMLLVASRRNLSSIIQFGLPSSHFTHNNRSKCVHYFFFNSYCLLSFTSILFFTGYITQASGIVSSHICLLWVYVDIYIDLCISVYIPISIYITYRCAFCVYVSYCLIPRGAKYVVWVIWKDLFWKWTQFLDSSKHHHWKFGSDERLIKHTWC